MPLRVEGKGRVHTRPRIRTSEDGNHRRHVEMGCSCLELTGAQPALAARCRPPAERCPHWSEPATSGDARSGEGPAGTWHLTAQAERPSW